jgi:hypothetical protein
MAGMRKDRPFAEGLANGLIRHDREIARANAVFVSTFAVTGGR